ncbi:phage tail protein [Streptomyces sp. NPDC059447]|uniref:phage tail protein n=1 Tax=Streptomyces sp. NPDC059447 TaxID=3346834 RepID=UPI0036BA1940
MSLVSSTKRASDALRNLKTQASGAAAPVKRVGDAGRGASGQLKTLRTNAQGSTGQLKNLKSAADQAEKAMAKAGQTGQRAGTQLGRFKTGADRAASGQDKLNKSMKGNFLARLLELFMPLIEKIVEMAMRSKTMQAVIKAAFGAIKTVISAVMKAIRPIIQSAGNLIKSVWNSVKSAVMPIVRAIGSAVSSAFNGIKSVISTVMNAVRSVISSVWNGIKAVIMPVVNWIKSAIPSAFNSVKNAMSSAWNGLRGIAAGAFGAILGAVRSPINSVIGLINGMIGRINRIRVSVPGWVPIVGGKSFGVSLPTIPMLATGGVVMPRSGGVPAILAEAGEAEAVLPLSKLDRLLARTAARARMTSAAPGSGGDAAALHIEHYYAAQNTDPQRTADALMYLAKARG